ncbi:MAG: 4Fe-4S binding protein [Magnetococcus sp. XQGC-1]
MSVSVAPLASPASQPKGRILLVFLAMGAFAQIAQALLIREWLVVFQGNEISIGAFYGGWLFWIAMGGWGAVRWEARRPILHPLSWVQRLLLLLPPLFLLQLFAVRSVRYFLEVPAGQFIPLGTLLSSAFLLTLPVGFALGLLFPLACKELATNRGEPIANLYAVESLGALLGALLFTFFLVDTLEIHHSIGLLLLLMAGAGGLLRAFGSRQRDYWLLLTLLLGLLLTLSPWGKWLTERMEAWRFASLHPTLHLVESVETRYGHVAVGELGGQYSVVEDGRITGSFPDPRRVALDGALFYTQISQRQKAPRVLLFGGLNDGLAFELLKYELSRLDVVVQDERAFAHIRARMPDDFQKGLQDPRLFLHFGDGRSFVNHLPEAERFDLVLLLLSDPDSVSHNRYYTHELYARMKTHLTPDAVLCTRVSGASNYLGRDVKSYSGSVFRTLGELFPQRIAVPGEEHTFCAATGADGMSTEAAELARRYREHPPKTENPLPDAAFATLLQADRVQFLRSRLEAESGEINTDLQPVTFFLNMLLWGKFTASNMGVWFEQMRRMGSAPYWIPLAVAVTLFVLGGMGSSGGEEAEKPYLRQAALFALLVLGFVAMAGQLLILFGFQATVGAIYGRIALLNGLFMSGLALGAHLSGRWPGPTTLSVYPLLLVLSGVAGVAWLFPLLVQSPEMVHGGGGEIRYECASTLLGLLTGAGFALAARLARGSAGNALAVGGLAEAGDHLGGALGGVVTGGLLVPILGMHATAHLLAAMTLLAIPPLFLAPRMPFRVKFFKVRSHQAFAQPGLSRSLWFVLITVAILGALSRGVAPGPQTLFSQGELEGVAPHHHFTFHPDPVPFYTGEPKEAGRQREVQRAVALSSMPVAGDVRGYAGPLNLLLAADQEGKLLGVSLLSSHETPSYIQGLPDWLSRLAGRNPLTEPWNLHALDGISGATISSQAAIDSIRRAVAAGLSHAFGRPIPLSAGGSAWWEPLATPPVWGVATLLLLLPVVYLRGQRRERLLFLVAIVLIPGVLFNVLLTEVDLVNIGFGQFSSWSGHPAWWLLLVAILPLSLLFGQIYCGSCCPFGALSELLSRLGARLRCLRQPLPLWDRRARFGKFLLLALAVLLVWLTEESHWISFNPMQQLFSGHIHGWLLAIAAVSLLAALFFFRFWCRYLCPLGGFFALANKLSFLDRLAPPRHFGQCDLGVGHPYDVDCIRCLRCVGGANPDRGSGEGQRESSRWLVVILVTVFGLIALHLWTGWSQAHQESGGWRVIDIAIVKEQLRAGRLSQEPAEWSRPAGQ